MTSHLLIILSDLHLSAVQDAESGRSKAHDGFHYDLAFSHFIDHLLERLERQAATCEILLLGDVLDFLHTKVPQTERDFLTTTEAASLQKLQAILHAHPAFFEALKRFLSAGFHLHIVPGNHDIDLMRPTVRKALQESIGTGVLENLHFHSWIYYVPGLLYAEHGHQYHDIAAYTTLLTPFRAGHENELELPVAAYFDLYLFHLLERLAPAVGTIRTPLRYLLRMYQKHPHKLLATFPTLCQFLYMVTHQFAYRSSREVETLRKKYQEKVLSEYAPGTGLSHETCVALDRLAELRNSNMVKRLLGQALGRKRGDPIKTGYLYAKAQMISGTLRLENKAVPFYVFGHSHQHAKVVFENQPDMFYLNCGTWASPAYPGSSGDRDQFPFLEIEWGNDKLPTATLMQWDEAPQRPMNLEEA